ncbi:MAG: hypothetical protein COC15_04025 [Legionellales bacterium]|nr:MAG: hypothetical protein COC15_04025 [Legionellales bacterium]
MLASSLDGHPLVEVLLKAGAKVNAQDEEGRTALMMASYQGHAAVVKLLLNNGANVYLENNSGATALTIAQLTGKENITMLLLGAADKNKNQEVEVKISQEQSKTNQKKLLLTTPVSKQDQLINAVKQKNIIKVRDLLKQKVAVNYVDAYGNTALILAVKNSDKATVKLLLDAGANPELKPIGGKTALTLSQEAFNMDIILMLTGAVGNKNISLGRPKNSM